MKHDTFEQVAEGHIVIFGERLEHFEQAFFHADAGLDALDEKRLSLYHGTNVPMYINNIKPAADSMGGLLSTVRAARRLVRGPARRRRYRRGWPMRKYSGAVRLQRGRLPNQ
jgi:hypothetical protein